MKHIAFSFVLAVLFFYSCGSNTTKSEITAEMAYEGVSNYCHSAYDWSIAKENPSIMYVQMGNVWEFTSTFDGDKVVNCGGGWTSEANWCEANMSFPDDPDERFNNTGVRLVVK